MGLIYSNTRVKEELKIRNKIFTETAIPLLKKQGFEKSPFSTSWFGKDNLGNYNYELCKLKDNKYLEIINVFIIKGERWIQIYLNVFELSPVPYSIEKLKGVDVLQFDIAPNCHTKMRLRMDEYNKNVFFNMLFSPKYKLGFYYSDRCLRKRILELTQLIENDMSNIDYFVDKWHKLYRPSITNWNGERV